MRKMIHRFLTIVAMVFVGFLLADVAKACSCAGNLTVDFAFQQAPTVVILRLKQVEKYKEGERGYGYGGIKQSRLTVEKVFKGNLKPGQELNFTQGGGGDCIWTFDERSIGEEFLFYLG